MSNQKQEMLEIIHNRLSWLLKQEAAQGLDWKKDADEISDLLDATDIDWESPSAFVNGLRPYLLTKLVPQAIAWEATPQQAENAVELVNNLLASDHHLEGDYGPEGVHGCPSLASD
jgi:hypothetical protein